MHFYESILIDTVDDFNVKYTLMGILKVLYC